MNVQEKRSIAILSMQRVVNYGSVLQAWSLRQMVEEVTGEKVTFLDIDDKPALPVPTSNSQQGEYVLPAAYPPGLHQKAKRKLIHWLSTWNKRKIRRFMKQELKLGSLPKEQGYNCVIVGSDEVFNHAKGVRLQLHGQIPQAEKCFTYAAACGSARAEDIAPGDRQTVSAALANFSAISVRDRATQTYVAQLCDRVTEHHLDPVLVGRLSQRTPRRIGLKKYLLVYAYGQRIRTREEIEAIQKFARKNRLKTVAIGGSQFWCDLYIPVEPMRMLDYFYHADYVVTDTFHGAVFSVINHKQFAVLPRRSNENKISGLLLDLALEGRLVENVCDLEQVLTTPVDYSEVEAVLQREKVRTYSYLKKQLGV